MLHQLHLDSKPVGTGPAASPPPGLRRTTYQEGLVKLEQAGKLLEQLVDRVEPLQEHGALLVLVLCVLLVAAAVPKLVPEIQPVRFHQHLETLQPRGGSSGGPLREGRGAPRQERPNQGPGSFREQAQTWKGLQATRVLQGKSPRQIRGLSTSSNSPRPALSRPSPLSTSRPSPLSTSSVL